MCKSCVCIDYSFDEVLNKCTLVKQTLVSTQDTHLVDVVTKHVSDLVIVPRRK